MCDGELLSIAATSIVSKAGSAAALEVCVKRIAQSALVTAFAVAACSSETIIMRGGPSADPDAGDVPVDDAGNPVVDAAPPATASFAKGLSVSDIAVFQGVKVTIVKGGSNATHNGPIVANRDGVIRVYAKPDGTWTPHAVTAYLALTSGSGNSNLKDTKLISGPFDESDSTTMFEFKLPAAAFQTDTQYSVQILDPQATGGKTGSSPAQFPNDGSSAPIGVKSSGAQLKVYYFPVVTSGLTPPTDNTHMAQVRATILSVYPIPDVAITVKPAVSYPGGTPQANGAGWGQMLQWLSNKRQSDGVAPDIYYYGAFTPTPGFNQYCANGCVAGLSTVGQNVGDSWTRASIGLGYAGAMYVSVQTGFTAAHEIGHAHGRNHANCGGAQGIDPQFPYASAGIGVWGYSIIDHTFTDPTQGHDMMGYCQQNEWISDYTYSALFNRLVAVNGASMNLSPEQQQPRDYRIVDVDDNGGLTWGDKVTISSPVFGDEKIISYLGSDGHTLEKSKGYYYGYDHIPGGYLLIPLGPSNATKLMVENVGLANVTSALAK